MPMNLGRHCLFGMTARLGDPRLEGAITSSYRFMDESENPDAPNTSDAARLGKPRRPRVVIAEDWVVIQEHIKHLLKPECEVVAAVEDGESARAAVEYHQPDVLLIDVSLPDMSGFAVTQTLNETGSTVKVIFLTAHRDKQYADRAFEIGAKGYLLKSTMASELSTAIRAVMGGGTYRSQLLP